MKKVLDSLIDVSQCGFLKGRNITDGMRTVLDIIEECEKNKRDGLLIYN